MLTGGTGGAGIDAAALQTMISRMQSSVQAAANLVNGYIPQLTRGGVDTGSLTGAARNLAWAQDQLPSLKRREELARAAVSQAPRLTVTDVGAGTLDFTTDAAAQAAGKKAGSKALSALRNHDDDDTFILQDLAGHKEDPAYLAAFFEALGPQGLVSLGAQVSRYRQSGDSDDAQSWAVTVGDAFAVASYQMPVKPGWLDDLHPAGSLNDPNLPDLGLIKPFLENGVYSASWLNYLGSEALQHSFGENMPGGMVPPADLDGIWTALANNPAVAAQFYSQHFSSTGDPDLSISAIMTSPDVNLTVADPAFAAMVQAATIPPRPWGSWAGSKAAYAANAQITVRFLGAHPDDRTSGAVRQALGAVAINYFTDMYNTVGAATDGIGGWDADTIDAPDIPGFEVTANTEQWGNFLEEVMRDKTASAQFLTYYSIWRKEPAQASDARTPWQDEQSVLMTRFILHEYQAAGRQAGTGASGIIMEALAEGAGATITSMVFGPEAGLAEAVADGRTAASETEIAGEITSAFSGDGDSDGTLAKDVPASELESITRAGPVWQEVVRNWFNNGGKAPTDVTFNHKKAIGDPTYYIMEYGGNMANFINSDGTLMYPNQMNQWQLAAYNAWLQSGALQAAAVNKTDADDPSDPDLTTLHTIFQDKLG